MTYGVSNGHVTDDGTWPAKLLWSSTVGYPSNSLASSYLKFLWNNSVHYYDYSISKILAAGLEPATIRIYFRDFILADPPHLWFMILFDFHSPSVESFHRKQRHIGIRIFIRIM